MAGIEVFSEVGRLKTVIVHSPGRELLAVTPNNHRAFLYDDILDLEGAREEHRIFKGILEQFSEVLELGDLLTETLEEKDARDFLLNRCEEITAQPRLLKELRDEPAEVLARRLIEGWLVPPGPFSEALQQTNYVLPPLPNLFFTRDAAVCVGDLPLISAMRFPSRWPEEVLLRTIFGFNPRFGRGSVLYDGSSERRHDFSIEGGDLHPLSDDVLLVGLSERTSVALVDELAEHVFAKTSFSDIIAVVLPERFPAIHLDMVWTQVDRNLCVAHWPIFRGPMRAPILHRRKGRQIVSQPNSLFEALRSVELPMDPIFCGGDDRLSQSREQWGSGCNLFAVGPGQALSYARNTGTLRELEGAGFKILEGAKVADGTEKVSKRDRVVITFAGAELVRGGGGPRCMTCPVVRED